jgi:hypothetical protein
MSTLQSPHGPLRTFFVSRELSTSPIITTLLEEISTIAKETSEENPLAMISIGIGKRVVTTAEQTPIQSIQHEQLVEIVDYDAFKQILLVIGKKEPSQEAAVHWMIHHAKNEIGAIVLLAITDENDKIPNKIPHVKVKPYRPVLDRAKIILKTLQNHQILYLEGEGILFTGRTISEIQQQIKQYRGLIK